MTPDWSGWPDVYANQETDVSSGGDKYPFPWNLHDNYWGPVFIDWLNQGTETDLQSTFDNGWTMDIMDSNYLWLDQEVGGGVWTDSGTTDTDWTETTKGTTEWQKKDYWQ
jgi:hypothetical protein